MRSELQKSRKEKHEPSVRAAVKQLSIFLILTLLLSAVSACGDTADGSSSGTENPSETGSSAAGSNETAAVEIPGDTDELPKLDFKGENVTILYRKDNLPEMYIKEASGDVIDDALYKSRVAAEERLNVKFEIVERDGTSPDARTELAQHVVSTVMAGDDVYDWTEMMVSVQPSLISQGVLNPLNDMNYLNFDKDYWVDGLLDQASIDGKLFFLIGSYSIGYIKDTFCTFFNKELIESYKLEDPYELVRSDKWTLDKLTEMSKTAVQDVNGDGKYDLEDKLGFVIHDQWHLCGFMTSTGISAFTRKGSDWSYSFGDEHLVDTVAKLNNLLFKTEGNYLYTGAKTVTGNLDTYGKITSKFVNDEILMMSAQLSDAVTDLREMKSNYGVIPFPKYSETQQGYPTSSRTTHSALAMPSTCPDTDIACAAIEALASETYRNAIHAYINTALKNKYSRDEASAEMYDLILDNLRIDFSYLYNNGIFSKDTSGSPVNIFIAGIKQPETLASSIAERKEASAIVFNDYLNTVKSFYGD